MLLGIKYCSLVWIAILLPLLLVIIYQTLNLKLISGVQPCLTAGLKCHVRECAFKGILYHPDPSFPHRRPSLASVMYTQQLSGLHVRLDSSSSLPYSSEDSDSDSKLVIHAS